MTATLTVRNNGPGTEDVFADPRLNGESLLPVLPISQATNLPLPTRATSRRRRFLVPTQTDTVIGGADASAPILLEMGFGVLRRGRPRPARQSSGNRAAAAYSARRGGQRAVVPRPGAARAVRRAGPRARRTVGMLGHTKAFDHDTASSTGDIWRQTVDDGQDAVGLLAADRSSPASQGRSPSRSPRRAGEGDQVRGVLYVDDFSLRTLTGNEQLAIPYSYRVR